MRADPRRRFEGAGRGALSFRSVEGGAAKARARDEIDRLTEARSVDARA